ncbi:mitochondrial zinc maintenance protein 1, mitochondrial [Westerdykella ornata]|uniref:Mitochondrial zinc maintenance protein 1, mitochondrial n=1 Tax=Westerdykella ornata TaxID=318751 RepID=A0A6A6JYV3_WESOR|nr:mitochondrial zinc maintenance protein 1, mitochondrial [Westerdykella ornata]KAF2280219.1 mitochondrial zinc maintenance protein 1, mitochondrial [Westerdykella ornata]
MALQAYRHLLRSTRIAFQGDMKVLTAARLQARQNFEANRGIPAGSEEMAKQIAHAEEVAKFLRENVVQGQAVDEKGESFRLRIHEHTERGNNEDIKKGKGKTLAGTRTKCCSA